MKQAVRAIVIKDGMLLAMSRNKFGSQYHTLVGGGVELGENLEDALHRELAEETGIQVANPRLVYVEEADTLYGTQYVYLCDYVAGEPVLSADSEEAKISALGQNTYRPVWLSLEALPDTVFVSSGLKQRILLARSQGWNWPVQAEHFNHMTTTL